VTKRGSFLISVLFLSMLLGGCIGDSGEQAGLDLVVTYDSTSGTIVEHYDEGELIETQSVELAFDFSQTTSDAELVRFGVNFLDGTPATTIEAVDGGVVVVEFLEHGLHEIALFALDDSAHQVITTITVRIELQMNWVESTTNNPTPMPLDSVPLDGETPPSAIIIESNVENPELIENIGGGRTVEITWGLVDESDSACQQKEGSVGEGQSISWRTVHFNTYEAHELRVQYEEGQDQINIDQTVTLQYEELETLPNI